jgi:hypothetical protein
LLAVATAPFTDEEEGELKADGDTWSERGLALSFDRFSRHIDR